MLPSAVALSDFSISLNTLRASSSRLEVLDPKLRGKLRLYAVLAPHMKGTGKNNSARWCGLDGRKLFDVQREDIDMSFGCTPDFTRRSVGYVGCSDGWQDLMDNFKMDWEFEQAEDGNIALMGEIDLSDGMEFTLGVGFGRTEHSASAHLLQAFATPFADQREKYVSRWLRTRAEVDLSAHTKDGGSLMRLSQCLLLAHEDKFSAHLEEGMVTNRGELVKGKPRHYVRITPADPKQNAASPDPDQAEIVLANGHWPAKSAHSVRLDPYQDTFGATVSIRSRGISGGVDKSDMSDCWRVPT